MTLERPTTSVATPATEGAGRATPQARPAMLILRWTGHRSDIVAIERLTGMEFIARDVLTALGRPLLNLEDDPAPTLPLADRVSATSWSHELITEIFQPVADEPLIADFFRWLDRQVFEFDRLGLELVRKEATPALAAPVDEEPPSTFSVADAAKVLSKDPTILISRDRLFVWMQEHDWCYRHGDAPWQPKRDLVLLGYLVVADRRVPTVGLYPQICITVTGLQTIHKRLGGTAPLELPSAPQE